MTITRIRIHLAPLAAAAIVGACRPDPSTAPSEAQAASLARVLGEMQLPLPALSQIGVNAPMVPLVALDAPELATCSYDAAPGSFACAPRTASGLTVTHTFTLSDNSSATQSRFDPRTTAAVRDEATAWGTISVRDITLSIDQQQETRSTGLLMDAHTLNGTMTAHVLGRLDGAGTLPSNGTVSATIAGVVIPAGPERWPTAGTITMDVTVESPSRATRTGRLTLTFIGAERVPVVVESADTRVSCTLDLSGQMLPACP